MDEKIDVLKKTSDFLLDENVDAAKAIIKEEYGFHPVKREKRNYTIKQMVEQFYRDGFIDRYSGKKLVNPGMLRTLSELLPEEFPFQSHWKMDECHIAFWEFQPTLDHIYPIALGGADSFENWASTSMINNSIKSNFTLEQLGWSLKPKGEIKEWDGLSKQFVSLVDRNEELLKVKLIRDWYIATKEEMRKY